MRAVVILFSLLLFSFSASSFAQNQCTDVFTLPELTVQHGIIERYYSDTLFGVEVPAHAYKFEASLSSTGKLEILAFLAYPEYGVRSHLSGRVLYGEMITHFGLENIKTISGQWIDGTNHSQYVQARARGLNREAAALSTWSGQQAAAIGFSKVQSINDSKVNSLTKLPMIDVEFVRP